MVADPALQVGTQVVGVNQGAVAEVIGIDFTTTTGPSAYLAGNVDVRAISGSIVEGEQFRHITSITTGSALGLTITETIGANGFRTTTDPTGIIAPGDYVFLDDTDDSSFTQGYFQVFSVVVDPAAAAFLGCYSNSCLWIYWVDHSAIRNN